ncbi:Alpha-1,3-mannosyl-glycoprotein 2-beta-N-acetylglucosaminyltransferase [Senna tora]|uniref:Alpha-1,3-mannosyl-glycoprotein 2-beta-N-acetylglucosaminyltransferase n=1 Tax=Senna tora TaxID=362788 RepID=A0A834XAU9_9FABA|nr:Alpha-1,3-mannosyl-glycoprotein 2-beta-N-acetylglucosaminyltransferase [Senna tora]
MEANRMSLHSISDDMEIAPDFFDYFDATSKILDKDNHYPCHRNAQLSILPEPSLQHLSTPLCAGQRFMDQNRVVFRAFASIDLTISTVALPIRSLAGTDS